LTLPAEQGTQGERTSPAAATEYAGFVKDAEEQREGSPETAS